MSAWNEFTHRNGPLPIAGVLSVSIILLFVSLNAIGANYFGSSDSTIRSREGHDLAGTTTNRPTNMSVGQMYFNQTTMRLEVANGTSLNHVASVPDSLSGVGLPNSMSSGAGGPATGTTAGGAGGTFTILSGAGGSKTTTGAAAGGAAGALSVTGANGGNTASSGSDAGGAGANVTITSGTGGNATAGTGNGGAAGNVNIALGTGGTSAGGTAGVNGQLQVNGTAGIEQVSYLYNAPATTPFFVATRPYTVLAITFRPLVVGSDGGTVTAVINYAPSGTALGSGTTINSGTANLKGTINTNQVLSLSANTAIASGAAIGIVPTGVTTAATGVVTVLLNPN